MTNQQGAPEALRLADEFKLCNEYDSIPSINDIAKAEAELRRLHAENEALRAQQDDAYDHGPQAETVEEAARDVGKWLNERPNRPLDLRHVAMLTHHAKRAAHVQNPAEIAHVAGDVSKNGPESNMAQQPAPSAAAASKAVLAAIRAANMQLVRTGDDEFILVTLKQATPQADSQPAPVEELDDDACRCEPTDYVRPADYDGDGSVAAMARRAARAQADSVTAPAGGVADDLDAIALARYKVVTAHESMFHRFAVVAGDGKQQLYLGREVECENMARKFAGAFLDGAFYQSNIAPTPPAQAADSVLEDAARYRLVRRGQHWSVINGIGDALRVEELDAAVDAARKQGGA